MIALEFLIGALVILAVTAVCRRAVYRVIWDETPAESDSHPMDVVIGWFLGGLFASLFLIVVVIAIGLGSAILGLTCEPQEVTEIPQPATSQVQP